MTSRPGNSWSRPGFKAHVVVEPDTGIISAGVLTRAARADGTVGIGLLAADTSVTGPVQALADSAYRTGDALAEITAAGHEAVIKPWPIRPAVPDGFTVDDFTVHGDSGTASCPNGTTRMITRTRNVVFGVACRTCPLASRCTTSRSGRTLQLYPTAVCNVSTAARLTIRSSSRSTAVTG